jgi:hypothetical protein
VNDWNETALLPVFFNLKLLMAQNALTFPSFLGANRMRTLAIPIPALRFNLS